MVLSSGLSPHFPGNRCGEGWRNGERLYLLFRFSLTSYLAEVQKILTRILLRFVRSLLVEIKAWESYATIWWGQLELTMTLHKVACPVTHSTPNCDVSVRSKVAGTVNQ